MAGSRLDRIGTIFSRLTGLLKTGAVKYQDRPLWYDVYKVFPPKYEPQYDREPESSSEVPKIMYKEDKLRAKYFETHGFNPGGELRNLSDPGYQESCQLFLQKCSEYELRNPSWPTEKIFEAASEEVLRHRVVSPIVSTEDPVSKESSIEPERKMKKSVVTVESLLKLFKEAKEEDQKTKK